MNPPAWRESWFSTGIAHQSIVAWRGVEAQHVISTTRLVDHPDEQETLEQLLERSKPAAPEAAGQAHVLVFTPFRYRPRHESRFRRAGARGLWYGAEHLHTACAEVAYWRHRFVMDSDGLKAQDVLTEHTFFQCTVDGAAIDLMEQPWVTARRSWTQDRDYSQTQALAQAAVAHRVQWIAYESVRDPGFRCAAVLDVQALAIAGKGRHQQTWHCKANRQGVWMLRGQEQYFWAFRPSPPRQTHRT